MTHSRSRVRDGDPAAFSELFDEHARSVYNHAWRLTADRSTAEDVMSATFLEAWRLHSRVEPEGGSLRPWLLGIATNVARNHMRGNRRYRATVTAATAHARSEPDHAESVAERLDDAVSLHRVLRLLSRLSRKEREVLTLCLWEEIEHTEVAKTLGIPVGTVRSRLHRARKRLRKALDEEEIFIETERTPLTGQTTGDRATPVRLTLKES